MAAIAAVYALICFTTHAANILWYLPMLITDDKDVIICGSLDRAYVMGYGPTNVVVNDVSFARFGNNMMLNNGTESLAEDQTTLVIAGDADGITSTNLYYERDLAGLSPAYQALLRSSVYDQGSALALVLNGLVIGKTYFFQSWMRDTLNPRTEQTVTGGTNLIQTSIQLGCCIIGTFAADNTNQTIIYTPNAGSAQINAFQLRVVNDAVGTVILKQPMSATSFLGKTASLSLSAFASSNTPLTYQWQKITATGAINIVDGSGVSGAISNTLNLDNLSADDAGGYQAVVKGTSELTTSQIATVTVLQPPTNQLINVAISDGSSLAYKGIGVLSGTPNDTWNNPDGRSSFRNVSLLDSTGAATPTTLTLGKPPKGSDAVRNSLLGDVSFAASQTVTFRNLEPNTRYDLVVFSAGNNINEGGVFSGAISGISHGYRAPDKAAGFFIYGTNYVENPFALSDAQGVITFTIAATATVGLDGYLDCAFNGLQLMKVSLANHAPVIIQQPLPVAAYAHQSTALTTMAASPSAVPLTYQWQKVTPFGYSNLVNGNNISGASSNTLTFNDLNADNCGNYQVLATSSFETVTSTVVIITVFTNQLINMAVADAAPATYKGMAVLAGTPDDIWNGVDARTGFANVPLLDSTGDATPVTLTLAKSDGDAIPHPLLGSISYASSQTVTINNLLPNEIYDLVVFSVGSMVNEGGVFSGAVNGMARGYSMTGAAPTDFVLGTNYVENPYIRTDAHGTLTFTIKPNATAMPGGYFNCDFNGLQLMKVSLANHSPIIARQPASVKAYLRHPNVLTVATVGPPTSPTTYQWEKISAKGTKELADSNKISGSGTSALNFCAMTIVEAGDYRVVAMNSFGSVTSSIAKINIATNQLINVAVNNDNRTVFKGIAVFASQTNDTWNGINARIGFTNTPLVDATGDATSVTLTLAKSDGDAVPHPLLGGISYASSQTVIINNLLPDEFYDLVVFSVGGQANEGGVFSGAVNGMARGYPIAGVAPTDFLPGTNYVENQMTHSDAHGTLTFTIKPNVTAMPGGYFNCDFNGLQLIEGFQALHAVK